MIRLRILTEGIYLLFNLMDFTAQTVSILISADRTVQFPQGLSCVPGFLFSCAWRCSGSPTVMNIFASLTNDECIVGSCKHNWLYIQTVFLVEVALTRTLEVKILNFQSTLQVFHQLVVHFSWTSFITFQISGGCWNPVLFWILFSNLRKHLQEKKCIFSLSVCFRCALLLYALSCCQFQSSSIM